MAPSAVRFWDLCDVRWHSAVSCCARGLVSLSHRLVLSCVVAIGGIAVGALGWRQLDPSFASFFDDAMVKVGAELLTEILQVSAAVWP